MQSQDISIKFENIFLIRKDKKNVQSIRGCFGNIRFRFPYVSTLIDDILKKEISEEEVKNILDKFKPLSEVYGEK